MTEQEQKAGSKKLHEEAVRFMKKHGELLMAQWDLGKEVSIGGPG